MRHLTVIADSPFRIGQALKLGSVSPLYILKVTKPSGLHILCLVTSLGVNLGLCSKLNRLVYVYVDNRVV